MTSQLAHLYANGASFPDQRNVAIATGRFDEDFASADLQRPGTGSDVTQARGARHSGCVVKERAVSHVDFPMREDKHASPGMHHDVRPEVTVLHSHVLDRALRTTHAIMVSGIKSHIVPKTVWFTVISLQITLGIWE